MTLPTLRYDSFVVIGLGGGWLTADLLAFFLAAHMPDARLLLIDGGVYEPRQQDHECFLRPGNKARIRAEAISQAFPGLQVEAVPKFVGATTSEDATSVEEALPDSSICFVQVDNNDTRRRLDQAAQSRSNATLLCGGTNEDQLRILVSLRRNAHNLTPPLSAQCAAIAAPDDESPLARRRAGCVERVGETHHPFTMLATSQFLLNAFYTVWTLEDQERLADFPYRELWYDIAAARCRTESNNPQP